MKKKLIGLLTAGVMAASVLAGCGSASTGSSSQTGSASSASESTTASQSASSTTSTATSGNGKTLVLYYSGSGHTKNVADDIAKDTGADEFEITPSDPYTQDDLNFNDDNSRVVKEHEDESLQDVKFDSYDIPNWDSYDTVFVGYPIWWMDASWVMKSYVGHVDFTGKTVIPFCTSYSSGLGNSGKNLADIAGTGDWQEGHRFDQDADASDVQKWVDSLNL